MKRYNYFIKKNIYKNLIKKSSRFIKIYNKNIFLFIIIDFITFLIILLKFDIKKIKKKNKNKNNFLFLLNSFIFIFDIN